jgi:hypothetical protein
VYTLHRRCATPPPMDPRFRGGDAGGVGSDTEGGNRAPPAHARHSRRRLCRSAPATVIPHPTPSFPRKRESNRGAAARSAGGPWPAAANGFRIAVASLACPERQAGLAKVSTLHRRCATRPPMDPGLRRGDGGVYGHLPSERSEARPTGRRALWRVSQAGGCQTSAILGPAPEGQVKTPSPPFDPFPVAAMPLLASFLLSRSRLCRYSPLFCFPGRGYAASRLLILSRSGVPPSLASCGRTQKNHNAPAPRGVRRG